MVLTCVATLSPSRHTSKRCDRWSRPTSSVEST